jgi:hypothetical protein
MQAASNPNLRRQVQVSELEVQAANLSGLDARAAALLDEQLTAMLTKIDAVDTLGRPTLRAVSGLIRTAPSGREFTSSTGLTFMCCCALTRRRGKS